MCEPININESNKLYRLKEMCKINSVEYNLASEMLRNIGILKYCCNPECKKYITFSQFMIFDSVFCSNNCFKKAENLLMDLWLNC